MRSWQEVVLYSILGTLAVVSAGFGIVSKELAGAMLSSLVTFVIGRAIPTKPKDDKAGGGEE